MWRFGVWLRDGGFGVKWFFAWKSQPSSGEEESFIGERLTCIGAMWDAVSYDNGCDSWCLIASKTLAIWQSRRFVGSSTVIQCGLEGVDCGQQKVLTGRYVYLLDTIGIYIWATGEIGENNICLLTFFVVLLNCWVIGKKFFVMTSHATSHFKWQQNKAITMSFVIKLCRFFVFTRLSWYRQI